MKNKLPTAVSGIMVLIPWAVLLLRTQDWALQSPTAEIMIGCTIALMVFGGIFTSFCYARGGIKNRAMQVLMVINDLYAFAGLVLACWWTLSVVSA